MENAKRQRSNGTDKRMRCIVESSANARAGQVTQERNVRGKEEQCKGSPAVPELCVGQGASRKDACALCAENAPDASCSGSVHSEFSIDA